MSDKVKVQGPEGLAWPWQKQPASSEAGRQLFLDYQNSIVKIENGLTTGTGWIGPDGRVVTAYHVIKSAVDLFAVTQDGKRYRLGGKVSIDDLNDIAALEFVGAAPDAGRLRFAKEPPKPKDAVRTLGHPGGWSLHLSEGSFSGQMSLAERLRQQGKCVPDKKYSDPKEASDFFQFTNQKWLDAQIPCQKGNSGGPLFNADNEVFSLCSMGKEGSILAPDHQKMLSFLQRTAGDEPFVNNGCYQTGIGRLISRLEHQPVTLALEGAFAGIAGYGLKALRPKSSILTRSLATTLAVPYVAGQGYFDVQGLGGSTNYLDTCYYGLASTADGVMLTGLAGAALSKLPTVHRAFKITAVAGILARAACELIPNHYVLDIRRAAPGDSRAPFLDKFITFPLATARSSDRGTNPNSSLADLSLNTNEMTRYRFLTDTSPDALMRRARIVPLR